MEVVRSGVFLFSLTPGNGTWRQFGLCEKTFQPPWLRFERRLPALVRDQLELGRSP